MKHFYVHGNLYSWVLILLSLSVSGIFADLQPFTSTRDGNAEIYLMNPRKLT